MGGREARGRLEWRVWGGRWTPNKCLFATRAFFFPFFFFFYFPSFAAEMNFCTSVP